MNMIILDLFTFIYFLLIGQIVSRNFREIYGLKRNERPLDWR